MVSEAQGHKEGSDCGLSGGQGGNSGFHCLSLSSLFSFLCVYGFMCVHLCVHMRVHVEARG